MNRASLLHILDHATTLAADDVRELEQLAQAFPYCQTAHLLLAKAAHDHGTMLAGQRLRRAATYAADRALLRQLIEAVPEVQPVALTKARTVAAEVVTGGTSALSEPVEQRLLTPTETRLSATTSEELAPPIASVAGASPALDVAAVPVPVQPMLPVALPETPALISVPVIATSTPPVAPIVPEIGELTQALEAGAANAPDGFAVRAQLALAIQAPVTAQVFEAVAPALAAAENPGSEVAATETFPVEMAVVVLVESLTVAASASEIPAAVVPVLLPDDLPVVAPPVRPPTAAVTARTEFGLGEEEVPNTPAYLLPGLTDEWTWPLPAKPVPEPALTPAAFTGDAVLGYGWGEGSRLGWALLPLASAAPATALLPPPGEFFPPDALLLAYWADHRPAALPAASALDLIDTFLRQKPRLSRPTLHKATTEALADLSIPSTRPEPEMASETLARILSRQGKLGRAIEIYERLMVKQPEKMAYFAAEIQQLQLQQPPLP